MRVSILIPCFNAEQSIHIAIQSALEQTWNDKEVIVVDDGSSDDSLRIIKSFGSRVQWSAARNRGGNAARNRLLELAGGEWLQYLDADDYLLPEKISQQMEFLAEHPECDVLFSPITEEFCSPNSVRREVIQIPEPHDVWILLATWLLPQTNAPLWRRQAVADAGGWKSDQTCCQEHELYFRLLRHGKRFRYCPTTGAVYRRWGNHTVSTKNVPRVLLNRLELEQQIEQHLREIDQLTSDRLNAINQARFEIARMMWMVDPLAATNIVKQIHRSEPNFVPSGAAAPKRYRFVFRYLGFPAAERLAAAVRPMRWATEPTFRQ